MRYLLLIFLIYGLFSGQLFGKTARIGISLFPPMVIGAEPPYTGFEIELWEAISSQLAIENEYRVLGFKELLTAVENCEVDVGMAGISITSERNEKFDFCYPHLKGGLSILVAAQPELSFQAVLESFTSKKVTRSFLYLLIFIFVCGHIVWYAEKGQDAISDHYFPGIFEAFWWCFVTMTTVGYGDIAPKKWVGRIVGVLVMLTGILFFGWFVAILSSSLSFERLASDIQVLKDLKGKKVATKEASTSEAVLKEIGADCHPRETIDKAYELLASGEVEAILFDRPILEHFLRQDRTQKFAIVNTTFKMEDYGFALPAGSSYRKPINKILLKLYESDEYEKLRKKWF